LNEPLFDKIRTIDKLGYIVSASALTIYRQNKIYFIIYFVVQSSYTISKISTSINDFNEFIKNNFEENHENYLEKFRLLKESKLIEFNKPFSDISEEINNYIEAITSKIFDFNLHKLFYDVCSTDVLFNDIKCLILELVNSKIKHYDLNLNKNVKKID
jgi:secreted Zn-dependent insulinase-like peptidase